MPAGNFDLYVSKETFSNELAQLDSRLGTLQGLLGEYQAKKEQARQVWGDEDENLAKAQQVCESAIQVVQKKIEETKASKDALQQILEGAMTTQSSMGSQLDTAKAKIDSLLN